MSRYIRTINITLAGIMAVALCGCGGGYDATVKGLVTLDGAPVPRGTISFIPSSPGPPAFAMIASDGKYEVRTGRESGLPVGDYVVTVAANESGAPGKNGGPPAMGKEITPAWYRDPATSGLSFKVEPGDQEINLELNSKSPAGWKPPRPLPASRPR